MATQIATLREGVSVSVALKTLYESEMASMPVVSPQGDLVGMVSEYDLIKRLAGQERLTVALLDAPAPFSPPFALVEDTPIHEIEDHIIRLKYRRIPVVDKRGRLTGMVSRRTLIRFYIVASEVAHK